MSNKNSNNIDLKELENLKKKSEKFWKTIADCKYDSLDQKQKAFREINIAPTLKYEIYKENTMTLYRYLPIKNSKYSPVLFIPSLINKNYILDLISNYSLIEFLVNNNIDCYIIDWGEASLEHSHFTFTDYIDNFINRAIFRILNYTKHKSLHLFGQCIGGLFSTIYASKYHEEKKIKSLINLTTPINFNNDAMLKIWTNEESFNLDKLVNSYKDDGVIPSSVLHAGFPFLDVNLTFTKFKNLYNFSDNEEFVKLYKALDFWANDNIPFPALVFKQFIRDFYQKNLLVNNKLQIKDKIINLDNLTIPVYNIIAKNDHVFPVSSAKGWRKKLNKNDKEEIYDGGHVAIIAALPIRFEIYKKILNFIIEND